MAYTASFRRGSQTIDLSSGYYQLERDFTPPGTNTAWNVAEGLYGNRGGGEYAGDKPLDRDMSFRVKVNGDSAEHGRALANALVSFLRMRDPSNPTQFWFKPNTLPEPLWGQFGASLRYEIVTADASVGELYGLNGKRAYRFFVDVSLRVKPEAIGAQQRVANASGGVFEDVLGSPDGTSKGLRIPKSVVNKMTNPVFSHATWNTGWTAGAAILESKNTDPRFCYPGCLTSAKLTLKAASGRLYSQSIAAGNTNKHSLIAVVAKPDGSAVTSTDMVLWYGADLSTSFVSLGNGLYLAQSDNFDGISAATTTGVDVKTVGTTIYLLAMQFEEKGYHTSPVAHGDMLGCIWTGGGTRGEVTSTRSAGVVKLTVGADDFSIAQGCFGVVWSPTYDYSFGIDRYLFSCGSTSLLGYYKASDDKFYFTDGTNTISTAAQTFAAQTPITLDFGYGPSGLVIYKDGVSAATGATYTPPAVPSYVWIGSDDSSANQCEGTLLAFDIYGEWPTQAQVTAKYTEAAALIAAGQRPAPIPWLWTKDGDGILDNCDDSTHDNWCVIAGVAGSAPAKYKHYITVDTVVNGYWIGGTDIPYGNFIIPTSEWFYDLNATANAAYCGGGYTTISALGQPSGLTTVRPRLFYTRQNMFIRMAKSSTTGSGSVYPLAVIGYETILGNAKTLSLNTTQKIFYAGSVMVAPSVYKAFDDLSTIADQAVLNVITAFNFDTIVDYVMTIPGDVAQIVWKSTNTLIDTFYFDGERALGRSATNYSIGATAVIGNAPKIVPERLNMLWGITGGDSDDHRLDARMTFTTFITPRWSLL